MIRIQTIAIKYSTITDTAFIVLGHNIITGMVGNVNYPKPPRPLDELAKLLEQPADACQAMKTGLKAATQQRDYLRLQAEGAFRELSVYAIGATPVRPDLWAEANFPLTKSASLPRLPSQAATGLVVADGPSPQTFSASIDLQVGMYGYAWRLFRKDTSAEARAEGFCYRFCLSREPTVVFDNLERNTAYGIECAAWNNTGPLQWTPAAFRIAQ